MRFHPGSAIGHYEVVARLSRGGMGEVYLTKHAALDRLAVVKVMLDPNLRTRFLGEARAAARLRHPNVVTIYEVGVCGGEPFIAMEYVAGETLAALIARRAPLTVLRRLNILVQICAGLAHAHSAGVVHCDIKPANIMLDEEGVVRILDFGIARPPGRGVALQSDVSGTLRYMSPEQAEGRAIDPRSDIFSLGAVAYELFAYQQAFAARSEALTCSAAPEPRPLGELVPGLDPLIANLVSKALEKRPEDRHPSAMQLLTEIRRIAQGSLAVDAHVAMDAAPRSALTPLPDRVRRHRRQAIALRMDDARRALLEGNLQSAHDACEAALLVDPNHRHALQLHALVTARLMEVSRGETVVHSTSVRQRRSRVEVGRRAVGAPRPKRRQGPFISMPSTSPVRTVLMTVSAAAALALLVGGATRLSGRVEPGTEASSVAQRRVLEQRGLEVRRALEAERQQARASIERRRAAVWPVE